MSGQGGRVPVRGGSHLRRGSGVRRASAGLSLTRLASLALVLWSVVALDQAGDSTFAVRAIETRGAVLTDPALVEATLLEIPPLQRSVFRYDTAAAASRLARLPAVRGAEVRALLPDRLLAVLDERVPVLIWVTGEAPFLVDVEGLLFAPAGGRASGPSVVVDRRASAAALALGGRLGAVDLAVARQLAAVTPGTVGSAATSLTVSVTDEEGFVLTPASGDWRAVFGLYGASVRGPDIVPLQVQCLTALLGELGEDAVGRVILSARDQSCGTFDEP